MPRETKKNFARPERVTHECTVVDEAKCAKHVLKQIPAHYIESIRNNDKINACCKEVENLDFHTEKTDPNLKAANKGVFTCNVCGSKHIRMAQGGGSFGA